MFLQQGLVAENDFEFMILLSLPRKCWCAVLCVALITFKTFPFCCENKVCISIYVPGRKINEIIRITNGRAGQALFLRGLTVEVHISEGCSSPFSYPLSF